MDRQNILAIILVLSLIVGGYVWYSYFFSTPSDEVAQEPESVVSAEFLARSALLDRTEIDTAFFENATFLELRDGAKLPPLPENRGRTNPFSSF